MSSYYNDDGFSGIFGDIERGITYLVGDDQPDRELKRKAKQTEESVKGSVHGHYLNIHNIFSHIIHVHL